MRPFEIVILAGLLLVLLGCIPPRSLRPPWLAYVPGLTLALVVVHLLLEGYRWQMVPAYSLAMLLFFLSLTRPGREDAPPDEQTSRRWRITVASLGLLYVAFAAVVPVLLPVFRLPEPTGAFEVGTRTLTMVDEARPETLTADPDDERELAVRAWYPTSSPAPGEDRALWEESPALGPALTREAVLPPFAFDYFSLVRYHAYPDAPPADTGRDYPVLIFSHGYSEGWAS